MAESTASPLARRCGFAVLLFSAALWIGTTICFIGLWDEVTAVTTFPQWSWAIAGGWSGTVALRLLRNRSTWLLLALWLLTTLYFADNFVPGMRGVVRGTSPSIRASEETFRVVALNCAGIPTAATEVMKHHPDIVLLQESPPSNQVAQLAREWFGETGSFVVGFDCVIVSRFPLKQLQKRPPVHFTPALLALPAGHEVLVTSVRLNPPLGRVDLWKPAAWRAYAEDRRSRRSQLQEVLEGRSALPDQMEIIGGDFNAPANDGVYRLLVEYQDSHRVAGRGWGNSALNTIPLFRPDQIWLKGLTATSSHAVRTVYSDHRMVVTDVLLPASLDRHLK